MDYNLDICNACLKKHGDMNINNLNNCYMDTATAFSNMSSINSLSKESLDNWNNCMSKKMKKMGRTWCDFQLNDAPVFVQTPHHFPGIFSQVKDKEKALSMCIQQCESDFYCNGCKNNCQTDYDAVVLQNPKSVENFKSPSLITQTKPSPKPSPNPSPDPSPRFTYMDLERNKPVVFWISFGIIALLLAFVLTVFIKTLLSQKIGQ